uniref:glycosyltransferase n=1 Tax=Phascolarctobacterium faecium TaxID=33025 RepID=UPI002675A1DB
MRKIAAVILSKNEEKNIQAVIENARNSVDEIIVIDSGSTDRTVEIARQCGAKVFFRQWDNDFSAQRNFALDKTDADSILYLDA